jgi:hypothetical protein
LNVARIGRSDLPLVEVLTHEFGHVVTLLGGHGATTSHLLTEGIAEYIEEDGRPIRSYYRFADVRDYVRSGQFDGDLDRLDGLFATDDSSVMYGMGYLTWRCIESRYGQEKLLAFAGDLFQRGYGPAHAETDLGEPWDAVERACASYIRSAVA